MSNDVHLARVSKIQRSGDKKVADSSSGAHRYMGRSGKETQQPSAADMRHSNEDVEFLFGSTSPRAGSGGQQHQLHILMSANELESPDHTQRDTNESDNNISSCSTLDIVNKVENLSLHQLETQVRELSQRLQQTEQQRADLQQQLDESSAEKELCFRRLEVVSAAHECRITEMHCVIAELSKKLRAKQESTILEEQEPEGSEISYQEGSVYNSELNLTNPDAECQTDPLDGADRYSATGGEAFNETEDNLCTDTIDDLKISNENNASKGQIEALQEEVLHLKAQIALLQSEIANSIRLDPDENVKEHAERESNYSLDQLHYTHKEEEKELNDLNMATTQSDFMPPLKQFETLVSPQKIPPIPKMAERVKLRCVSKTVNENNDTTSIKMLGNEAKNAEKVELLVAEMKQNNSMLESFVDATHVDNELQRLQRKIEHLKVRNTVLSLTLDECKEHCEHLYLLCGKYESNAIALQSAVNCSDRSIEAYDVMLALLESKLALMKDNTVAAEESRKAVEAVARHLLDRLESEKNICENSLGPWQNTFSIPADKACAPWTAEDDNRLRYHVSKLKGRRSTVQNTIVNLESPFSDFYEKSRLALESSKEFHNQEKSTNQLDLEMAVLMQELLNLREENISLKTKVEEADRERQYATDRIGILQEALKQLQLQLQLTTDSNALFIQQDRCIVENRVSYSEAEHAALTEQQLVEALTRENELKGRIQTLVASVSASQKMSDEKYEQLHNNVRELQKANLSLTQLLEQNKRKYQTRTRKLEQKIMEMNMELGRQTSNIVGGGCNNAFLQQQQQQQQHQQTRFKCKAINAKPLLQKEDNVPETTL